MFWSQACDSITDNDRACEHRRRSLLYIHTKGGRLIEINHRKDHRISCMRENICRTRRNVLIIHDPRSRCVGRDT